MNKALLVIGLLLLFLVEIARVYFIMPFPGGQRINSIDFAYWIAQNIGWVRILSIIMIAWPLFSLFKRGTKWTKIVVAVFTFLYGIVFYMLHFNLEADAMFLQPTQKILATKATNKVPTAKLVIGVVMNGKAVAYPIQFIGYHHQVVDTVGGEPIMVTYCTVCRTGRVFSTLVNGVPEKFRLVGMDHFNAMFEDESTKSWWQQATGKAITGKLKGMQLIELASQQMSLASWLEKYPESLVMQADPKFTAVYAKMENYDKGKSKGTLTRRDSSSWKDKSWVVGIVHQNVAKAYDWNELISKKLISDSLSALPLIVVVQQDSSSFHAYSRILGKTILQFQLLPTGKGMTDLNTGSTWNFFGEATAGTLVGIKLLPLPAYQEFWHSWQTFHPNTLR
jgi:hypothetical protein